jgi:hypothetical protein
MDPSLAGLIGVGIGAVASLLGAFVSNWLLMRNQKEQWLRDIKAEKEKWLRDRLQEIYSNCLYYLYLSSSHIPVTDELALERAKVFSETQKWLNLLSVYHPFKGTSDYQTFIEKKKEKKLYVADIIDLASRDPRLQIDFSRKPRDNDS